MKLEIDQIPINSIARPFFFDKSIYVGKAGTILKLNSEKFFVGGYSISKFPTVAKKVSKCEVIERCFLFAERKISTIKYILWPSLKECFHRSSFYDEIFDFETFDSSGLSYHNIFDMSCQHSAFELIERHLLSLIWYYEKPIFHIKTIKLFDNFWASFYCVTSFNSVLPFCLVVIKNKEEHIFIVGSAFSSSLDKAQKKAMNEAYLLLDNLFSEASFCPTENTKLRILSLKSEICFKKRSAYILKLCQGDINIKTLDKKVHTDNEIFEQVLQNNEEILLSVLNNSCPHFVVRASHPDLLKIRKVRILNLPNIPDDPFC